ncbi:MAG: DUF58 domain-containing protein [bacterium]|nr:DUF58 domain-containing protein [bacterium]
MIPKDVLSQIRRIEIKARMLVDDIFSGQYESVFKGRGMEFAEVREYQPGDDIRTIDWNVTARFGRPFVKKFVEERELTVMLLIDASGSERFGTHKKLKSEIAAEVSSILAFSAIRNNDKVGMIIFTDQVEKFVIPKKGRNHILRIIREILYFKPSHRKTDINKGLEYLNEVLKRKAVVFLISDFKAKGYERALRITNKRHDVIAITITDPREMELPALGFLELEDLETGEFFLVDTKSEKFRKEFIKYNLEQERARRGLFQSMNLDNIHISTHKSYIEPLVEFFKDRARRFR